VAGISNHIPPPPPLSPLGLFTREAVKDYLLIPKRGTQADLPVRATPINIHFPLHFLPFNVLAPCNCLPHLIGQPWGNPFGLFGSPPYLRVNIDIPDYRIYVFSTRTSHCRPPPLPPPTPNMHYALDWRPRLLPPGAFRGVSLAA